MAPAAQLACGSAAASCSAHFLRRHRVATAAGGARAIAARGRGCRLRRSSVPAQMNPFRFGIVGLGNRAPLRSQSAKEGTNQRPPCCPVVGFFRMRWKSALPSPSRTVTGSRPPRWSPRHETLTSRRAAVYGPPLCGDGPAFAATAKKIRARSLHGGCSITVWRRCAEWLVAICRGEGLGHLRHTRTTREKAFSTHHAVISRSTHSVCRLHGVSFAAGIDLGDSLRLQTSRASSTRRRAGCTPPVSAGYHNHAFDS